ncbi:hypothetical protein N656DRAFT_773519 [Canariomyces notabilis]|uniref:Uncharacterized protein n=1 Tax=Canariomyces notabilis TaxID=2074819 RepID=A0AAN6YX69_9PEZI|nr:hypothetical protein N656DRAFT_773519 [Canariomyces arenarius]
MATPPTRLDELRRLNFDSLCATRRALRPLAFVCRRLHVLSMPFLHSTVVLKNIVRTADTAISSVKEVRDLTDMPGEPLDRLHRRFQRNPSLGLFCRDLVLDMQTSWSMDTFSYLREPAAEMMTVLARQANLKSVTILGHFGVLHTSSYWDRLAAACTDMTRLQEVHVIGDSRTLCVQFALEIIGNRVMRKTKRLTLCSLFPEFAPR